MKCRAFSMLCWGGTRRIPSKTSFLSLLHSKTIDFTASEGQNAACRNKPLYPPRIPWGALGALLGVLMRSWGALGAFLGVLTALLGLFGGSWRILGRFGVIPGMFWRPPGCFLLPHKAPRPSKTTLAPTREHNFQKITDLLLGGLADPSRTHF